MNKRMFLLSIVILLLLLCFVSCGGSKEPGTTTPGTTTPPVTTEGSNTVTVTFNVAGTTETVVLEKGTVPSYTGSTIKLSDDTYTYRFTGWDKEFAAATEDVTYTAQYDTVPLVTYTVRWIFLDGDVTTTVKENDIPVPPSYDETITTNKHISTFSKWSSELLPLTQERASNAVNLMIVAQYDTVDRLYTVKFMVDGAEYATTETKYGEKPTLPATAPTKAGYNSFYWINSDAIVTDNSLVCEGLFALRDAEQLAWALNDQTKFGYESNDLTWDNGADIMTAVNCMLYLTYEIRNTASDNPRYEQMVSRVVEQLKHMVDPTKDAAPLFELKANWPYCNITAEILLCKETPVIWDRLSTEDKSAYDLMMECFAYVLTLGTDDDNEYETGPGLTGNYYKGWNPNYGLATVTPMIFIARYFGGADAVDALLLAFDYDNVIARMQEKGFLRGYKTWTTKPASRRPDPREIMMNGGKAYLTDGTAAGSGVGVRTKYTFKTYTLDEPEKIIEYLFNYNYSGGNVKSSHGIDSTGKPLAYIVGYLTSPYEGELGMMKEFVSNDGGGIRSSTEYCMHDFLMVVVILETAVELGMYDPISEDNLELFRLVWVGNQDFVYKYEIGYMSYSLGESKGVSKESTVKGYMLIKSLWNTGYGKMKLSDFPEILIPFDSVILDENYEGVTINSVNASVFEKGVDYYTQGMTGISMNTVTTNGNSYMQVILQKNGSDPRINLEPTGGLASLMGDNTSITITIKLAQLSDYGTPSSNFRLRGQASSSKDTVSIFTTESDGSVYLNGNHKLADLTTEFQTFTFVVDFEAGTLSGSVEGGEAITVSFSAPSASGKSSTLEWMKGLDQFVFNWWFPKPGSENRALLIDDFKIEVIVPQVEE